MSAKWWRAYKVGDEVLVAFYGDPENGEAGPYSEAPRGADLMPGRSISWWKGTVVKVEPGRVFATVPAQGYYRTHEPNKVSEAWRIAHPIPPLNTLADVETFLGAP